MEKDKSLLTHEEAVKKANEIIKSLAELDNEALYKIGSTYNTCVCVNRYTSEGMLSTGSTVAVIRCLPLVVAPPAGTPVVAVEIDSNYSAIRVSSGDVIEEGLETYMFDGTLINSENWYAPTLGIYSPGWTEECNTTETQRLARIILGQHVD